jgi:hypothetical protein
MMYHTQLSNDYLVSDYSRYLSRTTRRASTIPILYKRNKRLPCHHLTCHLWCTAQLACTMTNPSHLTNGYLTGYLSLPLQYFICHGSRVHSESWPRQPTLVRVSVRGFFFFFPHASCTPFAGSASPDLPRLAPLAFEFAPFVPCTCRSAFTWVASAQAELVRSYASWFPKT